MEEFDAEELPGDGAERPTRHARREHGGATSERERR